MNKDVPGPQNEDSLERSSNYKNASDSVREFIDEHRDPTYKNLMAIGNSVLKLAHIAEREGRILRYDTEPDFAALHEARADMFEKLVFNLTASQRRTLNMQTRFLDYALRDQ